MPELSHQGNRAADVVAEARIVQDMATRVVHNGGERYYSTEKLLRAHRCILRALVQLDVDPQDVRDQLKREGLLDA